MVLLLARDYEHRSCAVVPSAFTGRCRRERLLLLLLQCSTSSCTWLSPLSIRRVRVLSSLAWDGVANCGRSLLDSSVVWISSPPGEGPESVLLFLSRSCSRCGRSSSGRFGHRLALGLLFVALLVVVEFLTVFVVGPLSRHFRVAGSRQVERFNE